MSRADRVEELFRQGYNCSQSVFAAFADVVGLTVEEAAKQASPFGAGFGKLREVCGAVSGITMVIGYLNGYSDPADAEGKEAFEITDNYIKCRIPYDEKVLDMSNINVGINITEKAVLGILLGNPKKTADEMSLEIGVTKRTIERTLVSLKNKGLIERVGSNKSGSWVVIQ